MLEIALIIGIIFGLIRGGRLKRLLNPNFPFWYLLISGLLLLASINWVARFIPNAALAFLLTLLAYLLMLSSLWLNRKREFIYLILVGLLLNFLVIAVNGGMPVSFGASSSTGLSKTEYVARLSTDFKHIPMLADTKLKVLSDIIPLPRPYPLPGLFSVGDVFIGIGLLFFVQNHIYYSGRHRKSEAQNSEAVSQSQQ